MIKYRIKSDLPIKEKKEQSKRGAPLMKMRTRALRKRRPSKKQARGRHKAKFRVPTYDDMTGNIQGGDDGASMRASENLS